MGLSQIELFGAIKFSLEEAVAHWGNLNQGENSISINLGTLNLDLWNWAWAYYAELANNEGFIVDLTDLEDLAKTAFAFTRVLAMVVQVDGGGECVIQPDSVNGFNWFLYNHSNYIVVRPDDQPGVSFVLLTGGVNAEGTPVTPTSKRLHFYNSVDITGGTAPAEKCQVKVIIIGSTL